MSRIVLEAEQDGASVVVWEAAIGHRVVYPSESMAAWAASWLQSKTRSIFEAKKGKGVSVIEVYSEPMTSYQLVRRYLSVCRKLGYKVLEESESRPTAEFW